MTGRPAKVECGKNTPPSLGIKRLTVRQLLQGKACGLDHSEPHRLHFHVLILVTGGSAQHMVDFAPVLLNTDDLLIVQAGQVHAFSSSRPVDGEILTVTPDFVRGLSSLAGADEAIETLLRAAPCIRLEHASAVLVRRSFEELSRDLRERELAFFDARIACAFGLLTSRVAALPEFAPRSRQSGMLPQLVNKFVTLLESHFLDHREPAWYAGALHLSTRTLDRHLTKALRNTCKELITSRVMLEAKRLLADPAVQVKEVAHSLNFDEVANFSRFFHNNAGLTPRDFRTQVPDWII